MLLYFPERVHSELENDSRYVDFCKLLKLKFLNIPNSSEWGIIDIYLKTLKYKDNIHEYNETACSIARKILVGKNMPHLVRQINHVYGLTNLSGLSTSKDLKEFLTIQKENDVENYLTLLLQLDYSKLPNESNILGGSVCIFNEDIRKIYIDTVFSHFNTKFSSNVYGYYFLFKGIDKITEIANNLVTSNDRSIDFRNVIDDFNVYLNDLLCLFNGFPLKYGYLKNILSYNYKILVYLLVRNCLTKYSNKNNRLGYRFPLLDGFNAEFKHGFCYYDLLVLQEDLLFYFYNRDFINVVKSLDESLIHIKEAIQKPYDTYRGLTYHQDRFVPAFLSLVSFFILFANESGKPLNLKDISLPRQDIDLLSLKLFKRGNFPAIESSIITSYNVHREFMKLNKDTFEFLREYTNTKRSV